MKISSQPLQRERNTWRKFYKIFITTSWNNFNIEDYFFNDGKTRDYFKKNHAKG